MADQRRGGSVALPSRQVTQFDPQTFYPPMLPKTTYATLNGMLPGRAQSYLRYPTPVTHSAIRLEEVRYASASHIPRSSQPHGARPRSLYSTESGRAAAAVRIGSSGPRVGSSGHLQSSISKTIPSSDPQYSKQHTGNTARVVPGVYYSTAYSRSPAVATAVPPSETDASITSGPPRTLLDQRDAHAASRFIQNANELQSTSTFFPVSDSSTTPLLQAGARRSVFDDSAHGAMTKPNGSTLTSLRNSPSSSSVEGRRKYETNEWKARSPRGLVGLVNLGNTCFMNSVLQCLSNTPPLTDFFGLSNDWEKASGRSGAKGAVTESFANLLHRMWNSQAGCENPSAVKASVAAISSRFSGYDQQDAQEFLRVMLDILHEDTNQIKGRKPYREMDDPDSMSDSEVAAAWWNYHLERDRSPMSALFSGQLHSEVMCLHCKHVSRAFDPFWDLSVPIPRTGILSSSCSLLDCLNSFAGEERLSGDNAVYCRKCRSHRESTKRIRLYRLPNVLVVHMKRFAFSTYRRSKITTSVHIPEKLDVGDLCSTRECQDYLQCFSFLTYLIFSLQLRCPLPTNLWVSSTTTAEGCKAATTRLTVSTWTMAGGTISTIVA